jgi:UDP-N-acetylmuramyl tripeptide synthase
VVVIAGKGHETVQVIGAEEIPFDDRRIAADLARRA